ncbi:hypothetical protein GGF31_001464 [Allomyces arbusculus]|nr:hypothetical protein GGF31_001464 [Allomyces arbusculus]
MASRNSVNQYLPAPVLQRRAGLSSLKTNAVPPPPPPPPPAETAMQFVLVRSGSSAAAPPASDEMNRNSKVTAHRAQGPGRTPPRGVHHGRGRSAGGPIRRRAEERRSAKRAVGGGW